MRHGVHAARRRHARRQIERQFGIVNGGRRQRRGVVAADAVGGNADAPARRHFRAGIGGDDGDIGQLGGRGRGFGKPDRRAAADHDEAVGVEPLEIGEHAFERLARHIRLRRIANADAAIGDALGHAAREVIARFRAQHQKPRHFVEIGFRAKRADGAWSEHDAHRVGVIGEWLRGYHSGLISRTSFAFAAHPASKKPRSVPVET